MADGQQETNSVYSEPLKTTFAGVATSPTVVQFRGIKFASISQRFARSQLVTAYKGDVVDATAHGFVARLLSPLQRAVLTELLQPPPTRPQIPSRGQPCELDVCTSAGAAAGRIAAASRGRIRVSAPEHHDAETARRCRRSAASRAGQHSRRCECDVRQPVRFGCLPIAVIDTYSMKQS